MAEGDESFDVVVLGAGAAGMMCALTAGRRGRRVLLLEHGEHVGRKILISGGGRCNFTNLYTRAENFFSENRHFAKSALARFTPADMISMVEKHGIRYHEKTLGQMFCDGSAQQVVTLLEHECAAVSVETRCGVNIGGVQKTHSSEARCGAPDGPYQPRFIVSTSTGEFVCAALVVATGGLSIPKMGATGYGYELARQFGHGVIEPRAALVPLVFAPEDREQWSDLSGVSTEVMARLADGGNANKKQTVEFREKLLVTHRGVSGPAVLQLSSYWRPGQKVSFDLAPGRAVLAPLLEKNVRRDEVSLLAALRSVLPARWAERWILTQSIAARQKLDWTNGGVAQMEERLHAWVVTPAGTEGFAKAEVTAGGVDTAELDARTMQSKRAPGLFFIGEVVDVTGWLGGYNFQWAWASGVAAGEAV